MSHDAQAFLNNRYDLPDNRGPQFPPHKMVTIDIRSPRGESLAVLQSEDSRIAVDQTLRNNGWAITSWSGNNLILSSSYTASSAAYQPNHQPMPAPPIVVQQKKGLGCFGCLGILLIVPIIVMVFGMMTGGLSAQNSKLSECINTTAGCSTFENSPITQSKAITDCKMLAGEETGLGSAFGYDYNSSTGSGKFFGEKATETASTIWNVEGKFDLISTKNAKNSMKGSYKCNLYYDTDGNPSKSLSDFTMSERK